MNRIRCKECPAAFFQHRKSLYAHMRKFHDKEQQALGETDPRKSNKNPPSEPITNCLERLEVVKKNTKKDTNTWTNTHLQSVSEHNYGSSTRRESRLKCPYENCFNLFSNYTVLREHLLEDHSIEIEEENISFQSIQDFQKWKDDMQQTTSSYYSLDTAAKCLSSNHIKQYYNCHRSYSYKPKGKNIRSLKSTGSCKIGSACPSRIEVVLTGKAEDPTSIEVKFFKTHYGHTFQLGHTFLGKETRMQLAGKLQQGVTFQHIIDEIRDVNKIEEDGLQRSHIIDRKDLHNIVRDFNLSYTTKKHSNDAVSVDLWVKEMLEFGDVSPVLKYKRQNEHDNHGELNENDFMLVLMTDFQSQQLQKFGEDKICIDGTHGTNAYDIELFTLLVVDEYGAGCPVAFCFSNRSDETIFRHFFQSIKEKVGEIHSNIFMSDDAPAFYNAWSTIMGEVQHRLLCSWHIDHNWRQNLNKITNTEKRSIVYKTLKVLLHLDSVEKFEEALPNVLSDLLFDPDTQNFGHYFQRYYCNRTEMWAYCFRQHLGINTNMYLEAMHKTLKYYYLEGKKTRRLDKTIHAVMKLARDSLFNRIKKLSKNTCTLRMKNIQLSHNRSKSVTSSMITKLEHNEWLVKSSVVSNQEYIVQKVADRCTILNCSLKCNQCDICVHIYKCSCMDSVIKFNICKHIHAIFHHTRNDFATTSTNKIENVPKIEIPQEISSITATLNKNISRNLPTKNHICIGKKLDVISTLNERASLPLDEQNQVLKYLDKIISIMNKDQIKFTHEQKVNTNQNSEKQIRLFSTKKKNKNTQGSNFQRPSIFEEKNIKDSFEKKNSKILVFHSSNDHTYL